jgi:O-antigen ligase
MRRTLRVLLVVSVVPFILSLSRGAWIALTVALVYAAIALAIRGGRRRVRPMVVGVGVVFVILALSPLGNVVVDRAQTGHSNEHRAFLAEAATERALAESPIFGFGSPRKTAADRSALGSHGQMYFLLFSHGVPGLLLFLAWFGYAFWRLQGSRSLVTFWASLAILATVVEMPFHNLLPNEIPFVMAAMALAWREAGPLRPRRPRPDVAKDEAPRPEGDGDGRPAADRVSAGTVS